MKERPILFSGEMVRAILRGRKTQTRRVINPQPIINEHGIVTGPLKWTPSGGIYVWNVEQWKEIAASYSSPYGQPGNLLWVRETWRAGREDNGLKPSELDPKHTDLWWEADHSSLRRLNGKPGKKRPSIFMPRWASRITLQVTGVRVERVQDITENDAYAEGIGDPAYDHEIFGGCLAHIGGGCGACANCDPISHFKYLWNDINASRGYGWDKNPWVWVVEFDRRER